MLTQNLLIKIGSCFAKNRNCLVYIKSADISTSQLFSQAVFLMINELKDFSTLMVCHQLGQSWRQETHITGKEPVLLVTNRYNW